ncbi:bifunctional phosphopantothenoylcysteine decarboxylase/phosphopantothenate--cysteine ligase CoaBC [Frigoribacterium sp. CFBP 8754]|nr:bifunctional phosphopantothenoylcysteine decarboxylase/phosphopantothenate--cysteine ligase CoaBC [Frigoribacterium sp. CFBP 8754]
MTGQTDRGQHRRDDDGEGARRLTVVVGVSGGIAAYKAVSVVRGLVVRGHDVHVVPTEAALRFVGLPTFEAISRNPVHTSVFDDVAQVRHVALGQAADLVVVAPATAHTLAAIAHGLADDLLGTTILASTAPLVVAPAMHTEMWRNAATVANVELLRSRGVVVVGPDDGPLTGGDSGPGRLSEPDVIVEAALAAVAEAVVAEARPRDLSGRRVVVTAGGTREPLDPVRFLGNRSSGRQGLALARAAASRGAAVTLVAAHLDDDVARAAALLPGVEVVAAGTASELLDATTASSIGADVVVMAAAVADYRPVEVAASKIRKDDRGDELTLRLVRTTDVLAALSASRPADQVVVGFAAETATSPEELLDLGRRKLARKGCDLLVLNPVGWSTGFGTDDSDVVVLGAGGEEAGRLAGTKDEVAHLVLDAVLATGRLGLAGGGVA